MNINKAIKKQDKSHKRFLLILGFIFLVLPGVLFLSGKVNTFLIIYLAVIEFLVLITMIISSNNNYLKYIIENYKVKLKFTKISDEIIISCEKVSIVHVENSGPQMELILITSSRFRSKKLKPIDEEFIKKYPYLAQLYYRTKKHHPEDNYFYIIISKGGYHKYKLLDLIYRSCLQALYTDEAVERIKEYRNF
jgi:hypothetical protein